MNPWGMLLAALGLVLLFVAIRNSYGNLAGLVPGSGGAATTPPPAPAPTPRVGGGSPFGLLIPGTM